MLSEETIEEYARRTGRTVEEYGELGLAALRGAERRHEERLALADELAELAAHVNAGVCRWLERVAEHDRDGAAPEEERHLDGRWLAWRCGLSPREAREYLRVAHRLAELPVIHGAFARGELSYTKVRAITRVANADCEAELLELAGVLSASQLERALRAYERVTTEEALATQEREFLHYFWDERGSLLLKARLPAEEGALLLRALEVARQSLWERRRETAGQASAETSSEGAGSSAKRADPWREQRGSNVEALVAVADLALAHQEGERAGGDRCQVVVHVDAATLSSDEAGRCELDAGPALAPETARRLACDASLVMIVERDGGTLSVGRKTRTISPAMRRALTTRDQGCRFPGCENRRFVDAHHIDHWARGGDTNLDNLILLCRRHHRHLHEGNYTVERVGDGELRFRNRHGLGIPSVPRSPPADADALLERNRRAGLAIDGETIRKGWGGDRMDLSLAVDALMQIIG